MKIKTLFSVRIVLLLFLSVFVSDYALAGRVYIDVSASQTRKISIAVPAFQNSAQPGQRQKFGMDAADILGRALQFHGIISIVPAADYGNVQNADWRTIGADFVVLGQYNASAGGVTFELRLLDVVGNKVLLGQSFNGTTDQVPRILYSFCDSVIKELTGNPGIASTQIAFVSLEGRAKEVYITDILGLKRRQVTRHHNLIVSPRFVNNGKSLSYTSYHSGNPNLYITNLSQSKTTKAISRQKGMNLAPAWSPDGSRMILTLSKNGNPDLYMMDSRGQIIEQLTSRAGINVSPTWSPDGSRIVFVSDRSGKPNLYVMDLRTRQTQRITFEGSENAEPSWSPTEDLIAYSSLRSGVYQIYTVNPQGGTPTPVTSDLSHHESPQWSPDGNQIIFAKRDGRLNHIYAIMKNGSEQRLLFRFPGSHSYPQWSR